MSNKYRKEAVKNLTRSQIKWRAAGAVALFVLALLIVFPAQINKGVNWVNAKTNIGLPTLPDKGFSLGLDLQGGAHLVYQAKTEDIPDADRANAVEGVRDVIERRVRGGLGVTEPLVQTTRVGGDYRIIVELPGVTDVNQAIKMIGETPVLEFKEENNDPPRELTKEEKKQLEDYNIAAEKKARTVLKESYTNNDFAALVTKYSEDEKSKNNGGNIGFIDDKSLPKVYEWAKNHKDGDVSKTLIKDVDGWNIVKRISERDGDKYVSASHLLICYQGAQNCDSQYTKEQALSKIKEIREKATPANFNELVKQYSTDPTAKTNNGDLGKFKSGEMIKAFEDVAFSMPVGTISQPVETEFGYHLIYKKGEEVSKQFQVARILIRTKTEADIVPPKEEWKFTGLSGKQLQRAEVTEDPRTGQIQVSLKFNEEGTKLFADITTRNVNKLVAIFLDGQPISVPRVNEPILNGSAVISGGFTLSEARTLAQRLNSGALPVGVELISQEKVDATLGMDSLYKSFVAGIAGLIAVMLFMIIYYRLPGLLSVFSLLIYTVLNLALFKIANVTLTLAGVAGFIMSIGMAVDANVLVFERLKEELQLGKNLRAAAEESFIRAWSSIWDSHVTTFISCAILIWFGSGFIKGFAVVLAIGILINLFTAYTVTRTIMRFIFHWFNESNWLFLGHKAKEEAVSNKV